MPDTIVQHGEAPVDLGAPYEVGSEQAKPTEDQPKEKSDLEKRLDALEADNKAKDARIKELTDSEKYWSDRARQSAAAPPAPIEDEEEDPAPRAASDKPEKLLDEISTEGDVALDRRGYIKKSEVERLVQSKINETVAEVTQGMAFDQKLGKDFPELSDQNSELFKRAAQHFREMNEIDPRAKDSKLALYAAAKMAKKELDMENARNHRTEQEDNRRERIRAQAGDRGASGGPDESRRSELGPQARQIVSQLSRYGATEEKFKGFAGSGRSRRDVQ